MSWVSKWVDEYGGGAVGGATLGIFGAAWGDKIADTYKDFFGGGGVAGGPEGTGVDAYQDYLDWLKSEQERQRTLEGRELQTSQAVAEYRRNQIADRTGYAGLVTVRGGEGPDAVLRSDEVLAAEMDWRAKAFDPGGPANWRERLDPQYVAYEDAKAAERQKEIESLRTLSGEQYAGEDQLKELKDRFMASDDIDEWRAVQDEAKAMEQHFGWLEESPGRKLSEFIQGYIDARTGGGAGKGGTPPDAEGGWEEEPEYPEGLGPDPTPEEKKQYDYGSIKANFMASNDTEEWMSWYETAVAHDKDYGYDSGLPALIAEYLAQRGITVFPGFKFPKGFPGQG